jgi:hypothetical protein
MANKNCVCVSFNGYYIVPVPMVSISRSYDEDGTGRVIGVTTNIKLEGKIVAARDESQTRADIYNAILQSSPCVMGGTNINNGVGISQAGTDNLMEEERAIRKVFTNSNFLNNEVDAPSSLGPGGILNYPSVNYTTYPGNDFANRFFIRANGKTIIDGFAKVMSYSANETDNNWTTTINYSVELQMSESVSLFLNDASTYLIKSISDEISIEPLEEHNEWNPFDPVLSTVFGYNGYIIDNPYYQVNNMYTYPIHAARHKITRTIEAVGKHSFNENNKFFVDNSPTQLTSSDSYNDVLGSNTRIPNMNVTANSLGSAFKNAREYVLDRLFHYPTMFYLYDWTIVNRVRTTNANETNGSFRVTETSIAVDPNYHPPWADDWTAEVSVDATFLQTVRINGTIKGFETMAPFVKWDSVDQYEAEPRAGNTNEYKNLEPFRAKPGVSENAGFLNNRFPDINDNSNAINNQQLKVGKYQNALRGLHWLKSHLDGTNGIGGNPYNSPIVNRAKLFFYRTTSYPNGTTYNHNPYKYLNSTQVVNERNLAANATVPPPRTAFWNFGGQSNASFNPIPVNMTEAHRSHAGEIDYSIEFNNRPLNMIPGSVSESLSITDNFPVQQIAEVFVLGRRLGPVIQDLGTSSLATRDVTFEVVMTRPPQLASRVIFPQQQYQAAIDAVEQLNPKYMFGGNQYALIKSYVKSDSQNWNPLEGRISIQKSWTWQRAV